MKSEAFLSEKWYPLYESKPKELDLVLVFRSKNKRYTIAFLSENKNKEEDLEMNEYDWVTQHGTCFPANEDDCWMEFPYIRMECIYD